MADFNTCSENDEAHARVCKNVKDTLKGMSSLNFPIGEPSLLSMNELIEGCSPIPELVEQELLKKIFHQDELNENLTIKYYARKILVHLRTSRIEKQWQSFLLPSGSNKSLLEGALLVSQWSHVENEQVTSLSEIEDFIDIISNEIRKIVDYTISSTSETCSDKHDQTIVPRTVRFTLSCIKLVLYKEKLMGFAEMDKGDICNPDNACVDEVLLTNKGHALVLLIIYHEVAKRLGILCLPVASTVKNSLFLRHRINSKDGVVDILISPLDGGYAARSKEKSFSDYDSSLYYVVPAKNIFMVLGKYLAECRLPRCVSIENKEHFLHIGRLACIISSGKDSNVEGYAQWCNHFGFQLEQAITLLKSKNLQDPLLIECIKTYSDQQTATANREIHGRLPWTKYATGLVMIYKGDESEDNVVENEVPVNSTNETEHRHKGPPGGLCVIVSVHNTCQCCRGADYLVLFDNGNLESISEDRLELHPVGAVINNPRIGVFFERFNGCRYIPNAELMAMFPEDDAFAMSLMGK